MSDTANRLQETIGVAHFREALLRSERQNAWHIIKHVGVQDGQLRKVGIETEASSGKELDQGPPCRRHLAEFDSRDYGLRRPCPGGEGSLTEAGPHPGSS